MGKNKLKKFAEMKGFRCVVEAPCYNLENTDFPLKGNWNADFFKRPGELVLELGCGKGEYTVGLARHEGAKNFIGVDIKGARIYTGAKTVEQEEIPNAGFLRTQVECLPAFFAPGEVSELWITFPDPQLKKTNKRLTSTRFLGYYRRFMDANGVLNLKTDSPFLYEYTRRLAETNGLEILEATDDLYAREGECLEKDIKTFYEQQWLARGKTIKLLKFRLGDRELTEPDVSDLTPDDYRAAARFNRS
ncbi:MAG: tRNA (guanosine(46)-N7)-methyltransferase TrmB [Muribaculaceae bacterium]|nr:tRNA (guanosine(46)-N7)-methyltransferase TrmB [Muribaculaceae bacterium]